MTDEVVVDMLGHIDRMLTKCRTKSSGLIETMDVIDDLLDMRAVVTSTLPAEQ